MSHRVVLIFGAGSNIGRSVTKAFAAKGFKVALVARSLVASNSTADELHLPMDCSDTQSIIDAFAKVKATFGPPSVIVYNAYSTTENDPENVLEVPLEVFKKHIAVNLFSAYAAAQEAVKAWAELPKSASPTYIYTGNCTNDSPIDSLMDLSVGKSAAATFIQLAAKSYKNKHYKLYFADERLEDGSPMWTGLSGEGHARIYIELAEKPEQLPWQQTFVTGLGYKKF